MTEAAPLSSSSDADMDEVERAVHRVVKRIAPDLHTETRWGHPWYVGKDLVVVIGAFTHHVGVEFWRGASLLDPHSLLEGTGKNLRHVKLRSVAEAHSPAFASLLREAVRLDARSEKRTR
jgi:hypothetical protein